MFAVESGVSGSLAHGVGRLRAGDRRLMVGEADADLLTFTPGDVGPHVAKLGHEQCQLVTGRHRREAPENGIARRNLVHSDGLHGAVIDDMAKPLNTLAVRRRLVGRTSFIVR